MLSISNILFYSLCVGVILSYKQKALHEEVVRYTLEKSLTGHQNEQNVVKRMVFTFPWDEVDVSVELYPSRNLLGESSTSELSSFNPMKKQNEFNYFCEYDGQLKNMPSSVASFSVCDGLSGMILEGGATLLFTIFGNHSIENEGLVQLRQLNITGKCNEEKPLKISTKKIWTPSVPNNYDNPRNRREINQVPKNFVNGWVRYVETIIVADFSLNDLFDRDRDAIVSRCISIVNNVNVILKPLDIVVVLVDVDIIDSPTTLMSSNDHVQMLKNYSPWRANLIEKGKEHDYTIFLCGSNFYGETVGYAFIGTMCTLAQSTAVVQHYPRRASAAEIANVVAHEMCHTLGSRHDSSFCKTVTNNIPRDSCVMTGSSIKNSCWTNCTKIYIAKNIDRFSCLLNVPAVIKNYPSCGNGRVDHGEQCDCGAKWENPCCNCSTCHLKPLSVCATGPCCNLKACRPFPGGTLCRKSVNECDLPEYCSGYVEFCPKDVYKHNGFPCDSDKGLCYRGKCGSYGLWCEHFMIPSAKKPDQKYLDELLSVQLYSRDKICDSLFCQPHLKADVTSNANHLFNNRRFIAYQRNPLVAYQIDTDGLTCDANKTCIDKQCRPVSPPSNVVCASGCSGHGYCNSKGNCHCEDKFSPPDCVDPGFGGSIDSGYARNPHDIPDYATRMLWILLAVIPPVAILCCLWLNIKLLWDNNGKETCAQHFPDCSKFIESVCCPCMLFLNRWLCTMGYDALIPKPSYGDDEDKTLESRQTICQVDKDVKLPDAEVRTWGVASDALFTDLITITPKNSPRTTRKIRLPADSPILRSKSMEHLPESKAKPKYMKSISKDSGNVSDVDEAHHDHHPHKFKTSMSSLISTFAKYGQHKPGTEDTKDGDHVHNKKIQNSASKTQNLRRMVVDPLFNQKNVGSPISRPDYRRSLSTDIPRLNHSQVQRPLFPPPSPLGQNSLSNSPKIHSSEQHLHFISAEFETKQDNVLEKNTSSQQQERHSGSSLKITKALLPPNKKKTIEDVLPVKI